MIEYTEVEKVNDTVIFILGMIRLGQFQKTLRYTIRYIMKIFNICKQNDC